MGAMFPSKLLSSICPGREGNMAIIEHPVLEVSPEPLEPGSIDSRISNDSSRFHFTYTFPFHP
jgi:hypothetical protein